MALDNTIIQGHIFFLLKWVKEFGGVKNFPYICIEN